MMAVEKSPLAFGEARKALTAVPPPDYPKIVTLDGSPPKALMFFETHCKAVIMSEIP